MDSPKPHQDVRKIPLLPKDQYRPLDNIRTQVFFVIHERLDEKLLHTSLKTLIQGHLPILGARIKESGPGGSLEYELPHHFPTDYALFGWSTSNEDMCFSDVALLTEPTQPDAAITWGTPMPELEKIWAPIDWPKERKEEEADCPLLLVHLTHYPDFTVVATSLPHAVADQIGYASVIESWLDIAQNRMPSPFLTFEEKADIFDTGSQFSYDDLAKKGQYRLRSFVERARAIFSHAVQVMWDPSEERRTLFLSEESVSRLQKSFQAEIREKYGPDSSPISSNDVITSILAKVFSWHTFKRNAADTAKQLRYLNLKKPIFVTLNGVVNDTVTIAPWRTLSWPLLTSRLLTSQARGRHPNLPADQPFLHNALGHSSARIRVSPDAPAAEIAYRNRLAVMDAVKFKNLERCFAVHEGLFRGGYTPHLGEPGDTTFFVTNWCRAWRNIDFGAIAAARGSRDSSGWPGAKTSEGTAIVLGISMERSASVLRFSTQILSRAAGGFWCDFSCSKKNMASVDDLLQKDPKLETL